MFEESIAASRRLIEDAFGGGDLDLIDEICAEHYIGHDPLAGDQNRDASKLTMAGYREAFPDLEFTVEDIFANGDKVVVRWTGQGTFENELLGLEPTGERGSPVEGITIDRYEDGKLVESWTQWDTLTFLRDIGAVPEGAASALGN